MTKNLAKQRALPGNVPKSALGPYTNLRFESPAIHNGPCECTVSNIFTAVFSFDGLHRGDSKSETVYVFISLQSSMLRPLTNAIGYANPHISTQMFTKLV